LKPITHRGRHFDPARSVDAQDMADSKRPGDFRPVGWAGNK
jgi:hypothetical protein